MITEHRDHVEQLFERDEAAAMAELVLIDGHGQLVDFLPFRIVRVSKLAALATGGPLAGKSLPTLGESRRLLFNNVFHYDCSPDVGKEPLVARFPPAGSELDAVVGSSADLFKA
jgi:hypothetical protein